MAFEASDLTALKTDINIILGKITALATATDAEKGAKIADLIGAIIGLIITAIGAAMD